MGKVREIVKWFLAKRIRLAALIIVIIIAGFVFVRSRSNTTSQVQTQTAAVTKGTIVASVSASGSVISSNLYEVNTKASGVVKNVYVKDGDKVYKGQKIAEVSLDADGASLNASNYSSLVSAQNSVNSANNSYRSSQASLAVVYDEIKGHDTDETLAMKETRTKAEVSNDNAYDGLRAAQLKLVTAQLDYQTTSPIIIAQNTGTIQNISITPGMALASGSTQRVATINVEGDPLISVNISEIDVPSVEVGQKATVTIDSIPDKTFTGVVATIDKLGSTTSGVTNYTAIIRLDTKSNQLLANMAATANIITAQKTDVLIVPSSAVNGSGDSAYVSVMNNGSEQRVPVTTGLSSDTETEIVSGVSEGDEVVTGTVSTNSTTSQFSSFGGFGGASRNVRVIGR